MRRPKVDTAWWFKITPDGKVLAWHKCEGAPRRYAARRINTPGLHGFECTNCGVGAALHDMLWWEATK